MYEHRYTPEVAAAVFVVGLVGADDAELAHLPLCNREVLLGGTQGWLQSMG